MSFIEIETKEDTAEKLASAAGKPTKNYFFATELNIIVERIRSLFGMLKSNQFDTNAVTFKNINRDYFGKISAPRTGVLTFDFVGAVPGAISIVYYENATLQMPSVWRIIGTFVPNAINKIYLELDKEGLITANIPTDDITHSNRAILDAITAPFTVELKTTYDSTLASANAYAHGLVSSLVGASPTDLDTLQEISTALQNNPAIISTVISGLGNRLRFDINNQGLSSTEKANALANLGIVTADFLNRANHSGSQTASTISDFSTAVNLLLVTFKTANFLDFTSSGQTQMNTKSNRAVADTGYVISFDTPKTYNDISMALTSSVITNNLVGARIGVIQKMYIRTSSTNPFPAGWVILGFTRYTASALTIVYAEWVSGSRVEYWIEKPLT